MQQMIFHIPQIRLFTLNFDYLCFAYHLYFHVTFPSPGLLFESEVGAVLTLEGGGGGAGASDLGGAGAAAGADVSGAAGGGAAGAPLFAGSGAGAAAGASFLASCTFGASFLLSFLPAPPSNFEASAAVGRSALIVAVLRGILFFFSFKNQLLKPPTYYISNN